MLRNQPWGLICECDPKKIGQLISFIFSNQYIFTHPDFRKSLLADRKGYIHVNQLLNQHQIILYFSNHEISQPIKYSYIHQIVDQFCAELLFKNNRIRRIIPFDSRLFVYTKPICIQRIQNYMTISDIREHLGESSFSPIQHFQPDNDLQFLYIYAPRYRQKQYEGAPFKIIQYQKLCQQRQRESRYWEQQEKRFYMGTTVEDITQRFRRQLRMRGQFGQCRPERQMDEQSIEQQDDKMSLDQIELALRPNLQLNNLLQAFIVKSESMLDEQ